MEVPLISGSGVKSGILVGMSAARLRQTLVANAGLLILLCLFMIAVAFFYVSSERFFYSWDWANYQNMTRSKAMDFRKSPLWAIHSVKDSLGDDYNEIFTIPLLPFMLIFGDSRLVYITSVVLVYQLPFALVIGAIAAKLIPSNSRTVFWSTTLLTLLIPTVWAVSLRGRPDAGAAFLMGLAILLYVQDTSLRRWPQIALIGFLVSAAMIFRRHYAYDAVAFFLSSALQAVMAFVAQLRQHPQQALRKLFESLVRIGLVGVVALIILVVTGGPFLHNLLTRDHNVLYGSFRYPFGTVVASYASDYGWICWFLAVLGFAAGIYTRALVRPVAIFLVLFVSISFIQWTVVVAQLNPHFKLHFAYFIVPGIAALGWLSWKALEGRVRALVVGAIGVYLILNFSIGLAPVDVMANIRMRPLLSSNYPPVVHKEYDEIVRLVAYLRSVAAAKEPIYVVASSALLNYDLLRNAERTLYGRDDSVLSIPVVPDIDSRDFYPLTTLLQAQYVLVADPFEHHLRTEEQNLVRVVYVAFTENWAIAKDFACLPVEFHLENGALVKIYRRMRPTSLETALRTFHAMRNFIGARRPGAQPDWIILGGRFSSSVRRNQDGSYYIEMPSKYENNAPTTAILYLGILPEKVKVTGTLGFYDDRCSGARLKFAMVNPPSTIVDTAEISRRHSGAADGFAFSFETRRGSDLLLRLTANTENDSLDYCSLKIEHLRISPAD